jgi:hypothetical protein
LQDLLAPRAGRRYSREHHCEENYNVQPDQSGRHGEQTRQFRDRRTRNDDALWFTGRSGSISRAPSDAAFGALVALVSEGKGW